jgi:hypothetical protein
MGHKKTKKQHDVEMRAELEKELAKPRMAKSARRTELSLDLARIVERPSTTLPGTVDEIIPSPGRKKAEKAQVGVEGADRGYRDVRIENSLTDEHGDEVRLKKGAHVEVTVTAVGKV